MRSSLVFLTVLVCIVSLPTIASAQHYVKASSVGVSCFDKKDGKIKLEMVDKVPSSYQMVITDSVNQVVFKFDSLAGQKMEVGNLHAGSYNIILNGPDLIEKQNIRIGSPEKLQLEIIKIVKISGSGTTASASLQAFPIGGTPPYTYLWSGNTGEQSSEIANNLPLGIYNCKVNDQNKCGAVEATFFLFEDEIDSFNKVNNSK
jgi:hypothetical protein